jgi:hypothetical protein
MTTVMEPVFEAALRNELLKEVGSESRRRRHRRIAVVSATALVLIGLGGVPAVAGLLPAGDIAQTPLASPVIVNGVGPTSVRLPPAPTGARYLHIELICFDGTRCDSPGGGADRTRDTGTPMVERAALPVTDEVDPTNQQAIPPIDPAEGVPVRVNPGTHWRLYAVYTDQLNPKTAETDQGMLGIPGNIPPALVPAITTTGKLGWVQYLMLTDETGEASVRLTVDGVQQAPVPAYGADGTTVIGEVDVSHTYGG